MISLIQIAGILLIALGLIHVVFPRYFKWREELRSITLLTRQIHYVHTFFIALTVFLMGVLAVSSAPELVQTPLGRKVSLGFALFWLCRLGVQFFGYSSSLWKGKPRETTIHILFSFFWIFLTAVFSLAALAN